MTHESEIDKQIEALHDKHRMAIYDGPALPENIIDMFKVGLMVIPVSDINEGRGFNYIRVKEIVKKQVKELTWLEAGMIINFIQLVPPEKLFITLEEMLDFYIRLSDIVVEYNKTTSKWTREVEAIRSKLKSTSGIIKSTQMPAMGGRIIR
jgi:hypothetical protein